MREFTPEQQEWVIRRMIEQSLGEGKPVSRDSLINIVERSRMQNAPRGYDPTAIHDVQWERIKNGVHDSFVVPATGAALMTSGAWTLMRELGFKNAFTQWAAQNTTTGMTMSKAADAVDLGLELVDVARDAMNGNITASDAKEAISNGLEVGLSHWGDRTRDLLAPANRASRIIGTLIDAGDMIDETTDKKKYGGKVRMKEAGDVRSILRDQRIRQAFNYLTEERDFQPLQALGVIGNLMGESMLDVEATGDNGDSVGIQQWQGARRKAIEKRYGTTYPTYEQQLEFLADEFYGEKVPMGFKHDKKGKFSPGSGYFNYSRQDFLNAKTLHDAVVSWNLGSGRPHKNAMRNKERIAYAKDAAKLLGIDLPPEIDLYGEMGFGKGDYIPEETAREQQGQPTPSGRLRHYTIYSLRI